MPILLTLFLFSIVISFLKPLNFNSLKTKLFTRANKQKIRYLASSFESAAAKLTEGELIALKQYYNNHGLLDSSKFNNGRLYVPSDRPFSKSLKDCINVVAHDSSCKNLIGVDEVINNAYEIISRNIFVDDSINSDQGYRKAPLIFSRMARGGKSTILRLLFDKLKRAGYNVMYISFNSFIKFTRQEGESQSNAILRRIASQLIDCTEEEAHTICCDKDALDTYITSTTLPDKGFVLLIDELNALGPLDRAARTLLRTLFLDSKGRYMVATTHVPMTLDEHRSGPECGKV